ncbi:uncharacterized protein KZ484_025861 [Pholidichthys leucotaenia]
MSEVYRLYCHLCLKKKTVPLSRQVFCDVFKKMDLGLCDPKKDQRCGFGAAGNVFSKCWEEFCMGKGDQGLQTERLDWRTHRSREKSLTAGDPNGMKMMVLIVLLGLSWTVQAASDDPWGQCSASWKCRDKFADGSCDRQCMEPKCLRDGFDCLKDRGHCNPGHIQYCRDHYANSHCEQGCDSAACGWDGSDCFKKQQPMWAQGTLVLHSTIPHQHGTFTNSSLLWALSILLQSPLKLRGSVPFPTNRNLFDFKPQDLAKLLAQSSSADSNGSLLFLQVDNRPCSRSLSTCFPLCTEAASSSRAVMVLKPASFPTLQS